MTPTPIVIHELPSGFLHARGGGPCEWAQWPRGEELRDEHFCAQASERFRVALIDHLRATTEGDTR